MLTLEEINQISFHRAGKNGYNAADVDQFIDDVAATVEQLTAEKAELVRKLEILANKIEQYRKDEETVRNALITSQKLSDTTLKEAQTKADYIIRSAEKKAKNILTEAEMATEREKDKFEALHAETAALRTEIIDLYKKHLKSVVDDFPTEDEVKAKRQELDERYPFRPVEEMVSADVDADVDDETVRVAEPVKAEPEQAAADKSSEPRTHRHASEERYDGLKFGDNYDVE